MMRTPSVAFVLLLVLAAPSASNACVCSKEPPGKCAGFDNDSVVFFGTVTSGETLPAVAGSDPSAPNVAGIVPTPIARYHFRVEERFAGVNEGSTEIDIFSGGDDGDCAFRFEVGQKYVVFTHPDDNGRPFATICAGTRPANEARALIPQLRAMRDGRRVASVFGIIRRTDPPLLQPTDDPDDPLGHLALRLRSRDDRFTAATDGYGVYSFYDVKAGDYRLTANLPARMELTQKTLTTGLPPIRIPSGACYEFNVDALPTGHIRGSVLGPDGKPLSIASVELYRAGAYNDGRPGLWRFQGAKGGFDFDHVGPGEYILVFNRPNRLDPNSPFPRAFYPGTPDAGEAKVIKLKDGEDLAKVNIQLGEGYATRTVRVHLKWPGERPAGEVYVKAQGEEGDNPAARQIADGLYEFTLLEDVRYTFSAFEQLDPQHAAHLLRRQGHAAADGDCVLPARLDANPVTVEPLSADAGSDPDSGPQASPDDITLTFAALGCAPQ
jgi:hypothetical protein